MLPRLLLAALLTLLLISPSAHAATYCVGTSCEGTSKPTIDAALAAAAANPGKDAIMLGEGPFTGAWTLPANNPVDLIGPLGGAKLVSTGTAGLVIEHPDALVENVTVQLKAVNGAYGVDVRAAGPKLHGIGVLDVPGTTNQAGIRVLRGAELNNVSVKMATPGSVAILATGTPTAPLDLHDVDLQGMHGLRAWDWTTPLRIDRLSAKGTHTGIGIKGAQDLTASNVAAWGGLVGLEVRASTGTLRHATLATGPKGTALWAFGSPLRFADSALVGGGTDLISDTSVELRHSAFRPARMEGPITQPGADNVDLAKSWHGLPSVLAGVLLPVSGSALIDTGTPGVGVDHDLLLRARPLDGDRDGIARRDIGAYEALEKTSVEPAKVTLIDPSPKAVPTPTPTVTPVVTPVPTPTPVQKPILSPKPTVGVSALKGRALRGQATGTVKRVQVSVKRGKRCATARGTLRRAKTCAWLPAKGTGRWGLTFKRALPRGRYEVRVRALDARGKVIATASRRVRRG